MQFFCGRWLPASANTRDLWLTSVSCSISTVNSASSCRRSLVQLLHHSMAVEVKDNMTCCSLLLLLLQDPDPLSWQRARLYRNGAWRQPKKTGRRITRSPCTLPNYPCVPLLFSCKRGSCATTNMLSQASTSSGCKRRKHASMSDIAYWNSHTHKATWGTLRLDRRREMVENMNSFDTTELITDYHIDQRRTKFDNHPYTNARLK